MWRVTKELFDFFTNKQKRGIFVLVFLMLFGGIIESVSVSLILPLCTAVIEGDAWRNKWYAEWICNLFNINELAEYIKVMLVLLIAVFVLKNLYLLFEYYCQYSFIAKSRYDTQRKLIESYISKPYAFFLSADTGEIIRIVTGDTVQMFSLLSALLVYYTEIIVAIALGVTVIIINPQMALCMIGILLVELLCITKVIKPILRKLGTRQRTEGAVSNKWLLQSISGIKSIKVTNVEDFFINNYSEHAKIVVDIERMNQTLSNLPRLMIEAFTIAGALLVILLMVIGGTEIESIFPQLSAFVVATVRLLPSVNRISSSINSITFSEGGMDNIIRVLTDSDCNSVVPNVSEKKGTSIANGEITFNNELDFRDITFKYPGTDRKIFDSAEFTIEAGQSIGIVGTSGAGKTTAVDLILGLLQPDDGHILVDGEDINSNISSWRNGLSYIPQSIYLLDDTIRANVAFGIYRKDVDEKAVWKALEEAQMKTFVESLPNRLDTKVGEQGVRLSGGQRQRIGIARALYTNPRILFFDEATSALDNETEAAIMEAINTLKGRKTLVIIAHRLSTISNCDVIYRVEDGKVHRE